LSFLVDFFVVACQIQMFRVVVASFVFGSAFAERVQLHDLASKSKFGSTCEELEENFHSRVVSLQTLLDQHAETANFGRTTQARMYMRALGIVRTLNRAKECSWVIEGDSRDITQVRAIVETLLADNLCASVARAELDAGGLAETEEIKMQSVLRAVSILNSEDCQVSDADEGAITPSNEEEVDALVDQSLDQAQDYADDLMDESGVGAFVEMDSDVQIRGLRSFMQFLGVAFLFILLALACTSIVALIGAIIVFSYARATIRGNQAGISWAVGALLGAIAGGVVGLGACSYRLVNDFLPRVSN